MINYKLGDLLHSSCDIIAHGCNAQGKMGSGVAKMIRSNFPEAYAEYRKAYLEGKLTLGTVIWANHENKLIANCITQDKYGYDGKQYVDYTAIEASAYTVAAIARDKNLSVSYPPIGVGLGGGDWEVVEKILDRAFHGVPLIIYCKDLGTYNRITVKGRYKEQ